MTEEIEVKKFKPPTNKIIVKPIMRARNPLVSDPKHEAFFLFGSASIDYCLPTDRHNNLINPFTSKAEQHWLEKELDLDLNYHKAKDNYWNVIKVRLGKDNKILNLQNPKHYIEYLLLRANKLYIAPSGDKMFDRATYRYALVSEEFETKKTVKSADLKIEAYKALGKLEDDKSAMLNFLKVYGNKVSKVSKKEFLLSEISKIVDEDIKGFLAVIRDKDNYELKLLIAEGVEIGAINKQGRKYFLPGGDPLCGEGDSPILKNVIEYLKSPAQQDIYTTIKARVENSKD